MFARLFIQSGIFRFSRLILGVHFGFGSCLSRLADSALYL
ncbi:hypothetical protein VCRA2127O344_20363 [Vibrio crassostreae]|nr:hypothetical protein VCRA2127O344_20363 [Vibrio crassostreae]